MSEDQPLAGLRRLDNVTISGTWQAPPQTDFLFEQSARPVVIRTSGFRLFWVEWYASQYAMTASMGRVTTTDGLVSVDMTADSPLIVTRAEWWRRLGYHVLWPLHTLITKVPRPTFGTRRK